MTAIHLMRPIAIPLQNARTGARYSLASLDDPARLGATAAAQIAAICSEPLIYDRLFAARLGGRPYGLADGEGFLAWAARGWREDAHYVFALTRMDGAMAGAVDIKSATADRAEIGYWLSGVDRGVMTPAVIALKALAWRAGYQSLFALVDADNARSRSVLLRAGFAAEGLTERNGTVYDTFGIARPQGA